MRRIVAFGGGGFSMEAGNPLLDEYVLSLVTPKRPKICFLPSASGDADHYIVRFYRAFSPSRCEPSHVSLFRRDDGAADPARHLLEQNIIYVGGGSVVSMLGVWRAHGIDQVLRDAWSSGVLLCGVSAGSLCWFREAVTAFHGVPQRVAGLGLLPWSNSVHNDGEGSRAQAYRRFLADGLCDGYAVDDGAALHFEGEELVRAVSSRAGALAYRMACEQGEVISTALDVTYLGGLTGSKRPRATSAGPEPAIGIDERPSPAVPAKLAS